MKLLTSAVLAATLLVAGPALADRGHDRGHNKHHWKQSQHYKGHHAPQRVVVRHVVQRPYVVHRHVVHRPVYRPAPVYYAPPAPGFGISVSLPSIYIPLR